jgi:hypothetical protein
VLLSLLIFGILIFIYLLIVKPDGTLLVTFTRSGQPTQALNPSSPSFQHFPIGNGLSGDRPAVGGGPSPEASGEVSGAQASMSIRRPLKPSRWRIAAAFAAAAAAASADWADPAGWVGAGARTAVTGCTRGYGDRLTGRTCMKASGVAGRILP